MDGLPVRAVVGFAGAAAFSLAARQVRALSPSGAIAATAVGGTVVAGSGIRGGGMLLAFFITSTLLGRLPAGEHLEQRRGRERDAVQVMANGGVAAILALASSLLQGTDPLAAPRRVRRSPGHSRRGYLGDGDRVPLRHPAAIDPDTPTDRSRRIRWRNRGRPRGVRGCRGAHRPTRIRPGRERRSSSIPAGDRDCPRRIHRCARRQRARCDRARGAFLRHLSRRDRRTAPSLWRADPSAARGAVVRQRHGQCDCHRGWRDDGDARSNSPHPFAAGEGGELLCR